ncbi:MAG: hypothetical protein LBQ52_08500 [Helicobacteraceae bacterium]|nr:hypothetical protein [Helicobacteraceae bacterium]
MSKCAFPFGDFHKNKRGQITEIWDYLGSDVNDVKDDKSFQEVCDFEVYNLFTDETKVMHAFEGTFIDALNYLNENHEKIRYEYD